MIESMKALVVNSEILAIVMDGCECVFDDIDCK